MNKQINKGKWREVKGLIRESWGDITEDELEKTNGNIDQIIGKIQSHYGDSLDKASKRVNSILQEVNKSIS